MSSCTPVAVVLLLAIIVSAQAYYLTCKPCTGEECDKQPENCLYGTVRDRCGRLVCAVGTGGACGVRRNRLGKCGDGLNCRCGVCSGCSTRRFLQEQHIDCKWVFCDA